MEYSIEKDALFCLCCHLFRPNWREQSGGNCLKKKENIQKHVGGFNSTHNKAWNNFEALKNQDQHIQSAFAKKTEKFRSEYRTRLNVSVDCV